MAALLTLAATQPAGAQPLDRPDDPVVVGGDEAPALEGTAPDQVVAFRYRDGSWRQAPVQVDERARVDLGTVYDHGPVGVVDSVYTDAGTFTGPDPDDRVDGDDEIALMGVDMGRKAPSGSDPGHVDPGSRVAVQVSDPLADDERGWAYLYRGRDGLDPDAGERYVSYDFDLLSGGYRSTYRLQDGPNPEDTRVKTPFYRQHFSDRWIDDGLKVRAGDAAGADILDRHKSLFEPGVCGRSENTFSDAEGAFVTNRDGPVRAIRSYIGANSGPYTQREHVFYRRRHDISTTLRVHQIPGIVDFFDYSPAATGMRYRSSRDRDGARIDGNPDAPRAGRLDWEQVEGDQGSLAIAHRVRTDIPSFDATSYYFDEESPAGGAETQCTGDAASYGASGPWVEDTIPNTDPRQGAARDLDTTRSLYHDPPGASASDAKARFQEATTPLRVRGR